MPSESAPTSNHDGEIEQVSASKHVDLFSDHEEKQQKVKPMDEEKRLEQEKYEKQIGYLTYLGQDTHESLGTQSWYNEVPKRDSQNAYDQSGEKIEIGLKVKHLHDPMFQFLKKSFSTEIKRSSDKQSSDKNVTGTQSQLVGAERSTIQETLKPPKRSRSPDRDYKKSKKLKVKKEKKEKKKKHKKEKRRHKHSSSSEDSEEEQLRQHKLQTLQKLRDERLQREREEQNRTKELLRLKNPTLLPPEELKKPDEKATSSEPRIPPMKQKYNSQFNPYLAKQNYSN